jgi:hypothetical protein
MGARDFVAANLSRHLGLAMCSGRGAVRAGTRRTRTKQSQHPHGSAMLTTGSFEKPQGVRHPAPFQPAKSRSQLSIAIRSQHSLQLTKQLRRICSLSRLFQAVKLNYATGRSGRTEILLQKTWTEISSPSYSVSGAGWNVTRAWRPFKDVHVGTVLGPPPRELAPLLISTFEKSE